MAKKKVVYNEDNPHLKEVVKNQKKKAKKTTSKKITKKKEITSNKVVNKNTATKSKVTVNEPLSKILKEVKNATLNGYNSVNEAIDDCDYTSQTEAYLNLLQGRNIFISGPAGSGKSFVVQKYCSFLKRLNPNLNIIKTSTTGLSALNIQGVTIHSFIGMGLGKRTYHQVKDDLQQTYNQEIFGRKLSSEQKNKIRQRIFKQFDFQSRRIRQADVLIIDEISMLSKYHFKWVIDRLKDLGVAKSCQVIVSGDFSQLPPVATKADISEQGSSVKEFCFGSDEWNEMNFAICYLDKLYRAKDKKLATILNAIADGNGDSPVLEKAIKSIKTTTESYKPGQAMLLSTNADVNKINLSEQSKNPNKPYKFKTSYFQDLNGDFSASKKFAQEILVPDMLVLKSNDTVMITTNLMVSEEDVVVYGDSKIPISRLCQLKNGMIGIFLMLGHEPVFQFEIGDVKIHYRLQPYMFKKTITVYNPELDIYEEKIVTKCEQLPLKLAYAISIHKSQGQTFYNVVADLTRCWMEGLGYVALSRAQSISGLTLLVNEDGKIINSKSLKINSESLRIRTLVQEGAKKLRKSNKSKYEKLFNKLNETCTVIRNSGVSKLKKSTK